MAVLWWVLQPIAAVADTTATGSIVATIGQLFDWTRRASSLWELEADFELSQCSSERRFSRPNSNALYWHPKPHAYPFLILSKSTME